MPIDLSVHRDAINRLVLDWTVAPPAAAVAPQPGVSPVRIMLHDIYLGHHFDGGTNGPTGEFYFSSITATYLAANVYGAAPRASAAAYEVNSTGANGATAGRFTKLKGGDWITPNNFMLWPGNARQVFDDESQAALADGTPIDVPMGEQVYLDFVVLESDDSQVTNDILDGLADAAVVVAATQGAQAAAAAKLIAPAITGLLRTALAPFGDDDVVIRQSLAFDVTENYDVGKFVKLAGNHDSYAVVSIQPRLRDVSWKYADFSIAQVGGPGLDLGISAPAGRRLQVSISVSSIELPYLSPGTFSVSGHDRSYRRGVKTPIYLESGVGLTVRHSGGMIFPGTLRVLATVVD